MRSYGYGNLEKAQAHLIRSTEILKEVPANQRELLGVGMRVVDDGVELVARLEEIAKTLDKPVAEEEGGWGKADNAREVKKHLRAVLLRGAYRVKVVSSSWCRGLR